MVKLKRERIQNIKFKGAKKIRSKIIIFLIKELKLHKNIKKIKTKQLYNRRTVIRAVKLIELTKRLQNLLLKIMIFQ